MQANTTKDHFTHRVYRLGYIEFPYLEKKLTKPIPIDSIAISFDKVMRV